MANRYRIFYTEKVRRQLSKIDPSVRTMIRKWIERNLEGSGDPRVHGKQLSGDLASFWRYRIGDYRLLVDIQDDKFIIVAVSIAHRSKVYKKQI